MRVGDLVLLAIDESIGIIFHVEQVAPRGVYDGRTRYWVAWQDGRTEWSWEGELEVINESRRPGKISRQFKRLL